MKRIVRTLGKRTLDTKPARATIGEPFPMKGPCRRFVQAADMVLRQEGKAKSLSFSASSEEPVDRWWGTEVLSHEKSAVRLKRANDGAMPLLFNHDTDDPIGMVSEARLEDGRLQVEADLFDIPRADELMKMIEGGLRNVSIGYRINVIEEDKTSDTFTVTDWEPYEVSIVSVPADPSVGVGRTEEIEYEVRMVRASQPAPSAATREAAMPDKDDKAAVAVADPPSNPKPTPTPISTLETNRAENVVEMEKRRKRGIENLCKMNNLDERYREYWIGSGLSLDEVSDDMLRIIEERGKVNPQPISRIGLSKPEARRFSLIRAVQACVDKDWTMAPFELECSREVAKKLGRAPDPRRFFVPFEVLERPLDEEGIRAVMARAQRDLNVAAGGAGGFLVSTDNVGFIEMLRNRSVAFRMGVRRLSGLQGNVTIPRQSAGATVAWLASETATITESQQTFVQVALTPKTAGAYTEISRLLLLQSSPGAEGIVTDDLAQTVATAADLAVLNGSGAAGQPLGIIGTAGIGGVTGTSIAYAGILEFQTDVAGSNVMPMSGGYVTTPAVVALLMQRVKFTSTASPLWEGNIWDGMMVGFRGMSSNQMPAANMLFGDWQEAVVAEWGVLEVEVNPYANFQAGIIGVRAIYTMDVGVRRPFAFSLATAIT